MSTFLGRAAFLLLLAAGITNVAIAQTFGSPKEEQGRSASMVQDAEKLLKITDRLGDIQKQKTESLVPIETKSQSVIEKWKKQDEALQSYINKFQDLHGASVVLLNAVALSLYATERNPTSFYLESICKYMPGEMGLFAYLAKNSTKKGDALRFYKSIGEGVLERNEMNIAMEGLQIAEQLAHSFNSLCNRASKFENWKK